MDRILITGSNSFTGKYLVKELKKYDNKIIPLTHTNIEKDYIKCDLTNYYDLNYIIKETQPNGIIHLGAKTFVQDTNISSFYNVNLIGTLNLLQAFKSNVKVCKKIIIASSANIYGPINSPIGIKETIRPNPVNDYAVSKLAMENMTKLWFSKFPIIIVRPFNYTGVGQDRKFLIPKIVSHFQSRKKNIQLGNIDIKRDFSDVRDIVTAYLKLFYSNNHSNIVNICSNRLVSFTQVINIMNSLAKYNINIEINNSLVRKNEIKRLYGDNSMLFDITQFKPSILFEQTLYDMYKNIER